MARVETSPALDRLLSAASDAATLLYRLQPLLAQPESSGPDTGTIGRHAPESREPWAREAAGAYWDLYFGARTMVRELRYALGLLPGVYADVYGSEALDVIRNLAPSAPDEALRHAARELERLVSRGLAVPAVDEDEPWAPLPARPGRTPPPWLHGRGRLSDSGAHGAGPDDG
jgi:hypothetical protein